MSSEPLTATAERDLALAPADVFRAFTDGIDRWFAAPGTPAMTVEEGAPFYFATEMDGVRHPHYGRFIELVPGKRVRMTWVTGDPGTMGAETVVDVEIDAAGDGSRVRVTHSGFRDEATRKGHADAWPAVLDHLAQSYA